jgi:GxxExxY protein
MMENLEHEPSEGTNRIAAGVVDSIWAVYKELGPGLLESIYEASLTKEFERRKMVFERQKRVPVFYRGESLGEDLRLDLIVEGKVIVEVKAVESLMPIHKAQLLTYLKLTGCELGLLVNFNTKYLKEEIKRVVLSQ